MFNASTAKKISPQCSLGSENKANLAMSELPRTRPYVKILCRMNLPHGTRARENGGRGEKLKSQLPNSSVECKAPGPGGVLSVLLGSQDGTHLVGHLQSDPSLTSILHCKGDGDRNPYSKNKVTGDFKDIT